MLETLERAQMRDAREVGLRDTELEGQRRSHRAGLAAAHRRGAHVGRGPRRRARGGREQDGMLVSIAAAASVTVQ